MTNPPGPIPPAGDRASDAERVPAAFHGAGRTNEVAATSAPEESGLLRTAALGINAGVVKPLVFQELIDSAGRPGQFYPLLNEPSPAACPVQPASSTLR